MDITKNRRWLILLTLAMLFALRTYNLSYNSLFLDEAIYIVVGKNFIAQLLSYPLPIDWIGGFPIFYPVLSALFYNLGGIIATRFFSVILGCISLILFYIFSKNLNIFKSEERNFTVGIISMISLGIFPIHLWLSRFAIYDMLSFTLLLGGLVTLQHAVKRGINKIYFISGLLLFLSFMAKYSMSFLLPLVIFISGFASYKQGNINKMFHLLMGLGAPLMVYFLLFHQELITFFTSQIIDAGETSVSELIGLFFSSLWVWYVFVVVSILIHRSNRRKLIYLFFISLLPLFVHLITKNLFTLEQNTLFSAIFLFPVAASVFTYVLHNFKIHGLVFTVVSIVCIFSFYSLPKQQNLENFWPNTDNALEVLAQNINADDKILAESGDIAVLALEENVNSENIFSPYYFEYKDNEGDAAYRQAIDEKYFKYIQTDGTSGVLEDMETEINTNYGIIYEEGTIKIYRAE